MKCKNGYKQVKGKCVKKSSGKEEIYGSSGVHININVGIGFVGFLTIVFLVLKLAKVIAWSWLWVFSPIWISISLGILSFIVSLIIFKIIIGRVR